jgi:ribosome maturation factor RimP
VSSPGIDRPLTRKGDFAKWTGHEVKIELSYPNAEGRKRFHGWIEREADGVVALRLKDGGEASIAVDDMSRAVLVLTDKLIQDARAKGQAAAEVAVDADEEDFDGEADAMSDEAVEDFDDVEVDDADEFEEGLDAEDEDLESDDKE